MGVRVAIMMVLTSACGGAAAPVSEQAAAVEAGPVDAAGAQAPCFPGRASLVASTVFQDLEAYRLDFGQADPAHRRGRYGECTIEDGTLRTPAGVVVAELHCGIQVKAPGVVDPVGLQIGASAQQVIDRYPGARDRALCWSSDEGRSQCWFGGTDSEADQTRYIVDGVVGDEMIRGPDALAFFRTRRIVEMQVRMYCH